MKTGRSRIPEKTNLPGRPFQRDPSEEQDPFAPIRDGIDYEALLARTWIKCPMVSAGVAPVKEVIEYYKLDNEKIAELKAIMIKARKEIADLVQKEAKKVDSGEKETLVYEFSGNPARADEIRSQFLGRIAEVAGNEFAGNSTTALDNGFLRGGRVALRITCHAPSSTKPNTAKGANGETGRFDSVESEGRIEIEYFDENGNRAGHFSGSAKMIQKKTMLDFDLAD